MTPLNPPPETARIESDRDRPFYFGRVVLYVLLLLISPVAVILCGFCCCLTAMQVSANGEVAAFLFGVLFGSIVALYCLVVVHKKLFTDHSMPLEDANDDSATPL